MIELKPHIELNDSSYDVYLGDRKLTSFMLGWAGLKEQAIRQYAEAYIAGFCAGKDEGISKIKSEFRKLLA